MKAMDELGSVLALAAVILGVCVAADGFLLAPDAGVSGADKACPGHGTVKSIAVVRQECVTAYRIAAGSDR